MLTLSKYMVTGIFIYSLDKRPNIPRVRLVALYHSVNENICTGYMGMVPLF